jgi:biopolymer transport protein ExbD
MKQKRRLFGKKKHNAEGGQVALQITSMADIFTILLVFLLKGLATDTIQISPSNGTKLPVGLHSSVLPEPALQLEITKDGLMVEKEFVQKLDNYRMPASLPESGMITGLADRLTKERDRQKIIAQANDSVKIDTRVIVLSDEKVPFGTMKPILRTLSANGYSDIKFAVVKE